MEKNLQEGSSRTEMITTTHEVNNLSTTRETKVF